MFPAISYSNVWKHGAHGATIVTASRGGLELPLQFIAPPCVSRFLVFNPSSSSM